MDTTRVFPPGFLSSSPSLSWYQCVSSLTHVSFFPPHSRMYPSSLLTHACILLPSSLTHVSFFPPHSRMYPSSLLTHTCILLPSSLTHVSFFRPHSRMYPSSLLTHTRILLPSSLKHTGTRNVISDEQRALTNNVR